MNTQQITQILKSEFQVEYNSDTVEKLREFSVRIALEIIETLDVVQKNQQRHAKNEDVRLDDTFYLFKRQQNRDQQTNFILQFIRWIMDDLRTNDSEAIILKKLENYTAKDFPFEDPEKEKDKEIYKAYVPMKNQQNLRRNAQLAIREEIDNAVIYFSYQFINIKLYSNDEQELRRKKDLQSLRLKSEQSQQPANSEKTKYQQIFFDDEDQSVQNKKKDFPQIKI